MLTSSERSGPQVEPMAASLNSSDTFVLALPSGRLVAWYGQSSGTLERDCASEVSQRLAGCPPTLGPLLTLSLVLSDAPV